VVIVGCDGSGKTTITYKLKFDENVKTIPTIGYNVESIRYRQLTMTIFDLGGNQKIRPLWRHHYNQAAAIIFVMDSSDENRMDECKGELQRILMDSNLSTKTILVLANKQDISGALSPNEIERRLEVKGDNTHVFGCSAMTGEGIFEALDWLGKQKW